MSETELELARVVATSIAVCILILAAAWRKAQGSER